MLKYFDDLVGKGIDFSVIMELVFYFSINTIPSALPLAVLLSSLMTFGRLGEHFELIAIKGAGISLLRILRPVFFFVILITILAFINSNYGVPRANIKAYSLLYDIKKKKPSMDLQEGQFYNGLPGYSIKVSEKLADGETLKDIIIYQHADKNQSGNNTVIMADSSRMYTVLNDRYLVLDLFNGSYCNETPPQKKRGQKGDFINDFYRNRFTSMKIVFNLASFNLGRTNEALFAGNRLMKNVKQLKIDADSMTMEVNASLYNVFQRSNNSSKYHKYSYERLPKAIVEARLHKIKNQLPPVIQERDSSTLYPLKWVFISADTTYTLNVDSICDYRMEYELNCDTTDSVAVINPYGVFFANMDSIFTDKENIKLMYSKALTQIRRVSNSVSSTNATQKGIMKDVRVHDFQRYRKYAEALSCLIMFLIGAPLGAIIKRGGLGLPVLISIVFYVIFYIFTMLGDKWSKTGTIDGMTAAWMANILLTPIGLFFLRQARIDARLFDLDIYLIVFDKVKSWYKVLRNK